MQQQLSGVRERLATGGPDNDGGTEKSTRKTKTNVVVAGQSKNKKVQPHEQHVC